MVFDNFSKNFLLSLRNFSNFCLRIIIIDSILSYLNFFPCPKLHSKYSSGGLKND